MLRRFNTLRDRSFALRSLATALRSGITPVEALSLLHRGRGPPRLARACHEAAALLQQGAPVHQALTRGEPPLVDPREVPLLIAAEQSGALAEVLGTLADGAEQASRDLTAVIARLAYPVLVFHLLAFVNGLVAFAGGSSALLAILGVLVPGYALIALLAWLCASAPGQALVGSLLLSWPLVGSLLRQTALLRYVRSLRMAYDAGVGLPRAAELAARSVRNRELEGKLLLAAASTARGNPIAPALEALSLLQDSELGLVRVGEQTGALSEALRKVEAFYADDVARGRTRLVSLVTGGLYAVVLILVASSVIGFYSRYLAQLR